MAKIRITNKINKKFQFRNIKKNIFNYNRNFILIDNTMRLTTLLLAGMLLSLQAHATTASFYADKFNGRRTANGEVFQNSHMTCASNQYKFGTELRVTNPKNGKSVVCRVNDRIGKSGRIDLTKSAFQKIAPLSAGIVKVQIEPINKDEQTNQNINLAYNEQP